MKDIINDLLSILQSTFSSPTKGVFRSMNENKSIALIYDDFIYNIGNVTKVRVKSENREPIDTVSFGVYNLKLPPDLKDWVLGDDLFEYMVKYAGKPIGIIPVTKRRKDEARNLSGLIQKDGFSELQREYGSIRIYFPNEKQQDSYSIAQHVMDISNKVFKETKGKDISRLIKSN